MMRAVKFFMMVAVMAAFMAPAGVATAQDSSWVQIDCGTVVKTMGNTVVIRLDSNGKTKVFKNVSPDIHFTVNGKEASVYGLRENMKVCGYREETAAPPITVIIEEHDVAAVVDEPDKYDAPPAPVAKPAPAPAPAPMLPKTGSQLPLAGFAGLMLLALSAGIAVLRRF
jgi:LPXTG-motif cell wall-anchored protein